MEHTYNNPVANAFVAMLIDGSGHQKEKGALHFKGIRESVDSLHIFGIVLVSLIV